MKRIPCRFHLASASSALIVMTEAVNANVPDGPESFDEQRLAEGNPNIINK